MRPMTEEERRRISGESRLQPSRRVAIILIISGAGLGSAAFFLITGGAWGVLGAVASALAGCTLFALGTLGLIAAYGHKVIRDAARSALERGQVEEWRVHATRAWPFCGMDEDAEALLFESELGFVAVNSFHLEDIAERDEQEQTILSIASSFTITRCPGLYVLSITPQQGCERLVPGDPLSAIEPEEFAEATDTDDEMFELVSIPRDRLPSAWRDHIDGIPAE